MFFHMVVFCIDLASYILQRVESCTRRTPCIVDGSSTEPKSQQGKNDTGIHTENTSIIMGDSRIEVKQEELVFTISTTHGNSFTPRDIQE